MNVDVLPDLLTCQQAHTWVSLYPSPAQNKSPRDKGKSGMNMNLVEKVTADVSRL